jgi:hypothetical protein
MNGHVLRGWKEPEEKWKEDEKGGSKMEALD